MNASEPFHFRLYLAGDSPNSLRALKALQSVCRNYLEGRHKLEIVDVLREPRRALDDGVLLTPTLVKLAPSPVKRIIGNLCDEASLANAFSLL